MKQSFLMGILLGAAVTAIAFTKLSGAPPSLDTVKLSPKYYRVLLENEQVRVLEYHLKPGEKEQMHSHPARIVYSFADGRFRSNLPNGQTTETQVKAGEAHWQEPITHSMENTGNTELHALAVELKKPCK
jgi:beta-alanine degradation protein BauB